MNYFYKDFKPGDYVTLRDNSHVKEYEALARKTSTPVDIKPGVICRVIDYIDDLLFMNVEIVDVRHKGFGYTIPCEECHFKKVEPPFSVVADFTATERPALRFPTSTKPVSTRGIESVTLNKAVGKTTVVWNDGSREIASCSKQDNYDPAVGIALAMAYHHFGSKSKFHKFVNEAVAKQRAKDEKKAKKPKEN